MRVGKREVPRTHENLIWFPKSKITKGDIIDYYIKIAPYMLPYVKDYPLVMVRYPGGIAKEGWYHKERPPYFPDWVTYDHVKLHSGEYQNYVMADEAADLAYLAQEGTIVLHSWLSKKQTIKKPSKIIVDLDPPKSRDGFKKAKPAALKVKKILEKEGLKPYLMTTGQDGLHVICPIKPEYDYRQVKEYVHALTDKLAQTYPKELTKEVRKNKRRGRVFLDYLRNEYGQTGVAPFSVRAREGAPVATPIAWSELGALKSAQQYDIKNILARVKRKNAWKNFFKDTRSVKLK